MKPSNPHTNKTVNENPRVIPVTGGGIPLRYSGRSKLTINKNLADSHDETILRKIAPVNNAASMTPIPVAVLFINTDNIRDNVPTTTQTTQTNPKSIKIYCH